MTRRSNATRANTDLTFLTKLVRITVILIDPGLHPPHVQRGTGKFLMSVIDQPANGPFLAVTCERDLLEHGHAVVLQPTQSHLVPFNAADHRHQVRMPVLHQPIPRLVLQVQGENEDAEFGVSVLHQPIAQAHMAADRFRPSEQHLGRIVCAHHLSNVAHEGIFGPMRSATLSFCLFVLLVQALAADPMAKREAKARQQLAKGRPYKAISLCTGAIDIDDRPVFHVLRADAYNRIGSFSEAERDARLGLAATPSDREALLQLAIAEQGLGILDSAVIHYQQVIAADSEASWSARIRLAETFRANKKLDLALAQLDSVAADMGSVDGGSPLLRIKGECLAEQGDTAAARAAFSSALVEQPDNPIILNSRAWFLHAAYGDHASAIADYDRAIKRNPNYSYAFNNRGWSKFKNGDSDGALKDIRLAKKKKPLNPFIYRNFGMIALERNDKEEACIQFRRALELNFTAVHGEEVEQLVRQHCGGQQVAPLPVVNAPVEKKPTPPPVRTNAPE